MSFVNSMAISALTTVLTAAPLAAESFKTVFPGTYQQLTDEFRSGVDALDLQQGKIVLPGATAELTLPDGYYFLNASDSRYVLEKAWGNPQDSTLLGLILPRKISPFDAGSWAVTLQFDDIGYVSDADAGTHDYDEMLATMRADLTAENDWRLQNGFAKVELVGWAATPHYDQAARKLYWAKTLHFEGDSFNTLNYNIRAFGRKGVLEANFIASADQLAEIEAAAPEVIAMIAFSEGNRYADFVPGVDTVAAVGIGGLIAGKVLANTGFLLAALAVLTVGAALILLRAAWLWNKFTGRGTGRG